MKKMNTTLIDIYNNKVSKNLISHDENQTRAIFFLEKLNKELSTSNIRFFSKIKKKNLSTEKKIPGITTSHNPFRKEK